MTKKQALETGIAAALYGLPLVMMELTILDGSWQPPGVRTVTR